MGVRNRFLDRYAGTPIPVEPLAAPQQVRAAPPESRLGVAPPPDPAACPAAGIVTAPPPHPSRDDIMQGRI